MKFDELDQKMRVFETASDYSVLPEMYMVARLDGRSFTRLTKDVCKFAAPFDERFRDLMVQTAESLMTCGFRVIYAYIQSDEISLLFDRDEQHFGRKLRKYNSTLAGEASARFSLMLGSVATFDCRISQLPNVALVVDYFRWRNEDAARNALNAYCYWKYRELGLNENAATDKIFGLSFSQKNELLFELGINFNDVPSWQKRGIGLYWQEIDIQPINLVTAPPVDARRRTVKRDFRLPMKEAYSEFLLSIVS